MTGVAASSETSSSWAVGSCARVTLTTDSGRVEFLLADADGAAAGCATCTSEAVADEISPGTFGSTTPAALRKSREVALRLSDVEAVSIASGVGVAARSLPAVFGFAGRGVVMRSMTIGSGASSAGRFFER
jgi:hypothetical protein